MFVVGMSIFLHFLRLKMCITLATLDSKVTVQEERKSSGAWAGRDLDSGLQTFSLAVGFL